MVNTYCGDAPSYSPGSEAITSTKPDFARLTLFILNRPIRGKLKPV